MSAPTDLEALLGFYDRRGYDARIGAGRRPAVLVVDFSRAFTEGADTFPGGDFASQVASARTLLDAARDRALPVFFTTLAYVDPATEAGFWFVKVPWLAHCRAGTASADIDPRLGARPDECVIAKPYPSAFFRTDLEARLRASGVDTLFIAGCTTSVCVRATALDAMQRGLRPMVVADAVGDFDARLHRLHLKDLDARYADVVSEADALAILRAPRALPA